MAVQVVVKSGKCQGHIHKVGQVFTVDDTTPHGICLGAWSAIAPSILTLLYGGNFPWEKEKGCATIHCPDPKGIVFEIRRIENENEQK